MPIGLKYLWKADGHTTETAAEEFNSCSALIDTTRKRHGEASFKFPGNATKGISVPFVGGQYSEIYFGFAIRPHAPGYFMPMLLVQFSSGGTRVVQVYLGSDGALSIRNFYGNPFTSAPGGTLSWGVWQWVEWYLKPGNTDTPDGALTLKVNGQTILNHSNIIINTWGGAGRTLGSADFQGGNMEAEYNLDEIYLATGGFAGDARVYSSLPNGAGADAAWTPSAGQNWDCVNDATSDKDGTYVSSATVGAKDFYTVAPTGAPAGCQVKGVMPVLHARGEESGRTVRANIRTAAGNVAATPQIGLTTTYKFGGGCVETNPDTGQPFTLAEAEALQIGPEVVT